MYVQAAERAQAKLSRQLTRPGERTCIKYLPMRILTKNKLRVFDLMTGQEEGEDEEGNQTSQQTDNKDQPAKALVSSYTVFNFLFKL
jgi:hypothetical protein